MPDEIIQVSGIEEACSALDQMPRRLAKNAIGKALTAATIPIIEALEPRIPVDSGLLKESLVSVISVDSQGRGGTVAIGFGKQGFIARMQEFSHRIVGHKPKLTDKGKVKAGKPFMRPATEMAAEASVEAFAGSMEQSTNNGDV